MSVETRMDEFEKVSDKKDIHDVSSRMAEFEQVDKGSKHSSKDKFGTLPYGIKRVRPCLECGEFMEIQEIKEKEAIYYCKHCDKTISITTVK